LNKYFPGSRQGEITLKLTPSKFKKLFVDHLSTTQLQIIKDSNREHMVVAAGPGSGKTKVLVHKLASLLLMENVKHEQLLMLTFSRAAATEFKKRLMGLLGNSANFVEIKTFHSYCFDLLGRMGTLTESDSVVQQAIDAVKNGDIEPSRITKAVLVVDEAQDIDEHEYGLIRILMEQNEEIRVILVGDDDQNIYAFRGADSKYMLRLVQEGAIKYELTENYRSKVGIVEVANQWVSQLPHRLKSLPIMAHSKEPGSVKIVQHRSNHLIAPLIRDIKSTDLIGSTCVLTKTNDEAVQTAGLLAKNGFTTRLIQTNEGFNLYNLRELRFFTDEVCQNSDYPVIVDEEWKKARARLSEMFAGSNKLEWCQIIIDDFEQTNPLRKYKTDWKIFIMESKWEDFVRITGDIIYVSTIHKAKGKEFDNVFILLDNFQAISEESKRQLYVAMTRAKNVLCIHYNGDYLQGLVADDLHHLLDADTYPAPNYLAYPLGHRDVNLGYFEHIQNRIQSIQSGTALVFSDDGLMDNQGQLVLKFSNRFKEIIRKHDDNGYTVSDAVVNFNIFWKVPSNEKEIQILLPEITFKRLW
jgi:ATP-dependent DNA helicase RecQ